MLVIKAQLTSFQENHKNVLDHTLGLGQAIPAITAAGMAGAAPKPSVRKIKYTARKRSVQERNVDLSLARALGGIGPHHHALNKAPIRQEENSFSPKFCFADSKLIQLSMFTCKND